MKNAKFKRIYKIRNRHFTCHCEESRHHGMTEQSQKSEIAAPFGLAMTT